MKLAKQLNADITINALLEDPVAKIQKEIKGAHGVLVTAVSTVAFAQAINMLRPHGTISLVGLPPGTFELSIFDIVLHRKTVRGSIVGTRMDLAECLAFAAQGKVAVHYTLDKLENIWFMGFQLQRSVNKIQAIRLYQGINFFCQNRTEFFLYSIQKR